MRRAGGRARRCPAPGRAGGSRGAGAAAPGAAAAGGGGGGGAYARGVRAWQEPRRAGRGRRGHAGWTRPAGPAQRCAAVRGRYGVRAGRSGGPVVRAVAGPGAGAAGRPGPRAHPDPGRSLRGRDRAASRGLAHAPTDVEGMVRVGIVCAYSFDVPGGVQNHVRDLAETLIGLGHEVSVLAPADEDVPQPSYLVPAGRAVAVRYNGSVARLSFGPISAARVRRWLTAGRFDVLHVHEPGTPSVSMLAVLYARTPVVATFHTAMTRSRAMVAAQGMLRGVEVYVAPNVGGESFGMILTEAMAAGTPVVASDLDAFRRVLDGGRAGVLVPTGDPVALATALADLLDDPARRVSLAARAAQVVAAFDWPVVAARVVEVYATAIEAAPVVSGSGP